MEDQTILTSKFRSSNFHLIFGVRTLWPNTCEKKQTDIECELGSERHGNSQIILLSVTTTVIAACKKIIKLTLRQ